MICRLSFGHIGASVSGDEVPDVSCAIHTLPSGRIGQVALEKYKQGRTANEGRMKAVVPVVSHWMQSISGDEPILVAEGVILVKGKYSHVLNLLPDGNTMYSPVTRIANLTS